ncbi:MAG TPA: hypothetical protein VEK56_05975, partial [Vicinamibacterales bacterium]|nr:hypothetical protein [Vicinamibacterales bacterium]
MRVARLNFAILAGVFLVAGAADRLVAQDKRPLSFVDAIEVPSISDPRLSPDGKQIVFVMDAADWKNNRRVKHLYRINADGSNQLQLTFGERGESSPRWSPDGRTIAFIARRDSDTNDQIYLLDIDGGEARRLTNHSASPESPSWSPDGKFIWFAANDAKSADEREKERVRDDVYSFEETNFKQQHLWTTDLHGTTKKITEGDFSVTSYELSRDGKKIVMMRAPSPLLEHSRFAEVWVSDADGTNAKQLTKNEFGESGPSLSPDNATVAFTASANEASDTYYNDKIFLVPAIGGTPHVLVADVSFEASNPVWSTDGKSLFVDANMGVHSELVRVDVGTKQVTPLTKGDHALGNWTYSESAKLHVFTLNTATRPGEVNLLPAAGVAEPKQVTHAFDYLDKQFKIARQERLTWKGQDGQQVEGLLFYPVDYRQGQRYPLIVSTHGGPAASDKFGFSPEIQVYAGKGYAVLRPNYRGSTGYGDP